MSSPVTNIMAHIPTKAVPTAQLWFGSHDQLKEHAITFLRQQLCRYNNCNLCGDCQLLNQQGHYNVTWLQPEKTYTLESIADIAHTLSFRLEPDEHHFFVIEHADYLNMSCSNSLLKSLEEPPQGYHFILLATQREALLPTIISRCVVHSFQSTSGSNVTHSQLFTFFTSPDRTTPSIVLKTIDTTQIHEHETSELLNQLLGYWTQEFKNTLNNNTQKNNLARQTIFALFMVLYEPIMPGSSKILLKNLYIHMLEII